MTATEKNTRLSAIKAEMVAATIADDGEKLRELSQEKQGLKKIKHCCVCGQRTQGHRCNLHHRQNRFYGMRLAFASLAIAFVTGCASKPTDYKPVIGSYQLPPCKLVLSREDAAKFRERFQVDTNNTGRFVNLPSGFGVVTFPKANVQP